MHKLKILFSTFAIVFVVIILVWVLQPSPSIVEDIPRVENASAPVPDFSRFDQVADKKKAFFEYLKPAIHAQNDYIRSVRQLIQGYQALQVTCEGLNEFQQQELDWLMAEYRVDADQEVEEIYAELLRKVDIIPVELVLVQTANESAWGTSRFARKGYNFFGLWCFKEGCGFVPSRRNEGASHEVAKFDDLSTAMYTYMRNLNRHPAYKELRVIRQQHRNSQKPITANALAEGLTKYSERGREYVDELRQMIRVNKELMSS